MINKLGSPQGAWNEDIARLTEKVNELVELANSKETKSEPQKGVPKTTSKKASGKDEVLERKARIQSTAKGKVAEERKGNVSGVQHKDDQNYNI